MAHGNEMQPTPARAQWKKPWDFIFAAVGSTVGLGNIWRFPYLCFKNGGGAFLIPYLLIAILTAVPTLILELSIGQRVGKGVVQSWKMVPLFQGLAVGGCLTTFYSTLGYPVIMVWAIKYLVHSFSSVLPWSTCNNPWNTPQCVTPQSLGNISLDSVTALDFNTTEVKLINTSATTEYFVREVLHISSGIDEPGRVITDLALYLCVFWIIIYLCMFRGINWMAKVVYLTSTLPFLLIGVILIRGVTLDGALDGLKFYLVPDLARLKDPAVWTSAGLQVFYSFSVGSATLVSMASFNKRDNDFWRNSFLIGFANLLTSFLGGFAVFSALGYMAKYQNTTVEQVAKSGPGLVFVAYPETISLLPLPQLWSVLFFLTILLLGVDSMFASLETVMAALFDNIRWLRERSKLVRVVFYSAMLLVELSMVTEGGVYVFEIFNNYGLAGWSLFLAVTCESIAIGWLYGFENYWNEIVAMIGPRRGKTWLLMSLKYITPVTCVTMAIYYLVTIKSAQYEDYIYPVWAQCMAQLIASSSIAFIPGFAMYAYIVNRKQGKSFASLRRHVPDEEKCQSPLRIIQVVEPYPTTAQQGVGSRLLSSPL